MQTENDCQFLTFSVRRERAFCSNRPCCSLQIHSVFLDGGHYTAFCKHSVTKNWYWMIHRSPRSQIPQCRLTELISCSTPVRPFLHPKEATSHEKTTVSTSAIRIHWQNQLNSVSSIKQSIHAT